MNTDRLILEQQPYVRALARNIAKHLPPNADFEELVAYGQLGLVEAAKQFDASRGASFTTFAHYRIRGAIFDGLRKMTWLPPAARRQVHEQGNANDVLETGAAAANAGDDPEFLARQLSAAVDRLGAVYLLSSLREGQSPREDPADERAIPGEDSERSESRRRLRSAVEALPAEQAQLIRMLYLEGKSMSEVGAALQKNKSTVSRRHAEAVERLRELLGEHAPAPIQTGAGPRRTPRGKA